MNLVFCVTMKIGRVKTLPRKRTSDAIRLLCELHPVPPHPTSTCQDHHHHHHHHHCQEHHHHQPEWIVEDRDGELLHPIGRMVKSPECEERGEDGGVGPWCLVSPKIQLKPFVNQKSPPSDEIVYGFSRDGFLFERRKILFLKLAFGKTLLG